MYLNVPCHYRKRVLLGSHALDVDDCTQFIVWETDVDLEMLSNMLLTVFGGNGAAKGGAIVPFVS